MIRSVPDRLEKPFGRDFAAQTGGFRLLVNLGCDCEELCSLQIAAFGIGDLVRRGAALTLATHHVGKEDAFVAQQNTVATLTVWPSVAMLGAIGPRFPAEILILKMEFRAIRG